MVFVSGKHREREYKKEEGKKPSANPFSTPLEHWFTASNCQKKLFYIYLTVKLSVLMAK